MRPDRPGRVRINCYVMDYEANCASRLQRLCNGDNVNIISMSETEMEITASENLLTVQSLVDSNMNRITTLNKALLDLWFTALDANIVESNPRDDRIFKAFLQRSRISTRVKNLLMIQLLLILQQVLSTARCIENSITVQLTLILHLLSYVIIIFI